MVQKYAELKWISAGKTAKYEDQITDGKVNKVRSPRISEQEIPDK